MTQPEHVPLRTAAIAAQRSSWPDFRYGQQDLAALCSEPDVHVTEFHTGNMLFGFDRILREYAGLPPDEPLPWAMEHAITFGDPTPIAEDAATSLPAVLAVNELQAEVLRRHVGVPVVPIGSSFYYMRTLDERSADPAPIERRGTIVFPDKSVAHKDVDYDRRSFAEALAALPEPFQPVAVSIFWRDFERGTHKPFADAGLLLLTSGHSYDPLFLQRQYDTCRRFKYAAANDISTSFCLSVLSGCRFFYWPTGALTIRQDKVTTRYASEPTLALPAKQAVAAATAFPPSADLAAQRRLAELFAGQDYVRSPEFFRELFDSCRAQLRRGSTAAAQFGPGRRLEHIAGWSPAGVDIGGWTNGRVAFTVPPCGHEAAKAGASIRLHIQIRRSLPRDSPLLLEVGDERPVVLSARPGFWTLDIPISQIGPTRQIALVIARGAPARGAFRGLRILHVGWHSHASHAIEWRRQSISAWSGSMAERSRSSVLRQIGASAAADLLLAVKARRRAALEILRSRIRRGGRA